MKREIEKEDDKSRESGTDGKEGREREKEREREREREKGKIREIGR